MCAVIYYINTGTVCVCLSVYLSVRPREISRTEHRIAALLSPAQRDPSGELHKLLFEPIRRVVREEKCLELFDWLRDGARARTLHFPVTLGRINLAHRLNAIGAFSKVTGTIVDILQSYASKNTHVNELQRKKDTHP